MNNLNSTTPSFGGNLSNLTTTSDTPATTTTPEYVYPAIVSIAAKYASINLNYIVPSICAFGIITNIICCLIFTAPVFKLRMYHLLLSVTSFQTIALLMQVFTPVVTSKNDAISHSYATTVYRMGFRTWLYNAFAMCSLLLNLAVSFDRYIMISRKCNCFLSKVPVTVLIIVFCSVSLACFSFPMFSYYIACDPASNGTYFYLDNTPFGNSAGFVEIRLAMFFLRDFVIWLIFVVINVMLFYETKKYMNKKKALVSKGRPSTVGTQVQAESASRGGSRGKERQSDQVEMKMAIMIIVMSSVIAVGQMPYFIGIVLLAVGFYAYIPQRAAFDSLQNFVNNIGFTCLYTSFSVNIFLYYFFDRNFENYVNAKFAWIKSKIFRE